MNETQHKKAKFAHVKTNIITLMEKCVGVVRLFGVLRGEDWADWRGAALEERAEAQLDLLEDRTSKVLFEAISRLLSGFWRSF